MPLFWIGLAIAGGYLWWQWSKFPALQAQADALQLLNFAPYTLESKKTAYRYYLAREGLTPTQVNAQLGTVNAVLTRRHIPLPGPSTVPAYADLWATEGVYSGPTTIVTPATVLQTLGVPAVATNMDPARQLAGILYASTFAPTQRPVIVPIAAKQ